MDQYINEYTDLTPQEKRQLSYKRQFKNDNPEWNDSMILLRNQFDVNTNSDSTILDAGCGNGNFVIDELSLKFARKIGIDVDSGVTSKNISMDKITYGNLETMSFSDAFFDSAVSLWVLEHLSNPDKVFSEISRVLKPGGVFGFVTPNKNSYLIMLRRILNKSLANSLVLKFYGRKEEDVFEIEYKANTIEDIKLLAKHNGFRVIFLETNFDPSYTSFNKVTYFINKIMYKLGWDIFASHIVGILAA